MTVTLDMLRALLERALAHTDNPAILRLPEKERTVEGVARSYLARSLWLFCEDDEVPEDRETLAMLRHPTLGARRLDLTDPGTAHALLVAHVLGTP